MTETERRAYMDIHKIANSLGAIQKTLERIEKNSRPVALESIVFGTDETAHDDDLK